MTRRKQKTQAKKQPEKFDKKSENDRERQRKGNKRVEIWISIISLIVAGAALFISWRTLSNSYADLSISATYIQGASFLPNATPRVIFDNQEGLTAERVDADYVYCSHKIRLTNNGGSPASINNYTANAVYNLENVLLDGHGEAVAVTQDQHKQPFKELPLKAIQSVLISEDMLKSDPLDASWMDRNDTGIDFPLEIEPHTTIDFIVHTIATHDREDERVMVMTFPIDPLRYGVNRNTQEGFRDFEITYDFETVSNRHLATPELYCWSISMLPPGYYQMEINPDK